MAGEYQLLPVQFAGETPVVLRIADNAYIPFDPGNLDYQEYLTWIAEGNVADPSISPPGDET
jgi:hypothetical protein